jgi:hypothetical protein
MSTLVTPTEKHERLDGPIHGFYLVLHRAMMQSMPVAWQQRAVQLFDELDEAFDDIIERPPNFIVTAARECDYSDLTDADMAELGISYDEDAEVYHDRAGTEHSPYDHLLVPLPGGDPVPHYNRGRTFIEGTA